MTKKTNVKKHPRKTSSGRTTVRRHERRIDSMQEREKANLRELALLKEDLYIEDNYGNDDPIIETDDQIEDEPPISEQPIEDLSRRTEPLTAKQTTILNKMKEHRANPNKKGRKPYTNASVINNLLDPDIIEKVYYSDGRGYESGMFESEVDIKRLAGWTKEQYAKDRNKSNWVVYLGNDKDGRQFISASRSWENSAIHYYFKDL